VIRFSWSDPEMTHAIIRGKNGRRHEVDFADAPVRVEVHASEETVEAARRMGGEESQGSPYPD